MIYGATLYRAIKKCDKDVAAYDSVFHRRNPFRLVFQLLLQQSKYSLFLRDF